MKDNPLYRLAADEIVNVLEKRGFTTDIPERADGLIEEITEVIQKTFEKNYNQTISIPETLKTDFIKYDCNGWEDDLQNQTL